MSPRGWAVDRWGPPAGRIRIRRDERLFRRGSIHPATERLLQYLHLGDLVATANPGRPVKAIAAEIGLAPEPRRLRTRQTQNGGNRA